MNRNSKQVGWALPTNLHTKKWKSLDCIADRLREVLVGIAHPTQVETVRVILLLAISCVGLTGCGQQKMGQVAGRIVYAGDGTAAAELSGYRVSFLCSKDQSEGKQSRVTATGLVQEDGTFTVNTYEIGDGAVLGTHQIALTPPIKYGYDGEDPIKILIDPRYGSPRQSGLTAVVDGDTEVVLEVERAP